MLNLIGKLFTLIGFLTVLGLGAVAVVVGLLWWQDRQWQGHTEHDNE